LLFNSYTFLFVFLPLVLAAYAVLRRLPNANWAIGCLVLASLLYYSWWRPEFVLLVLASIAVNAAFGRVLLLRRLSASGSRLTLCLGIAFNLGVLFYFKYAGFAVRSANELLATQFAVPDIILPIGISFITFQKIAFLVDAYRGEVKAFSLGNFALFVTFFPQLIAGPIVHHSEVMPQFEQARRREVWGDLSIGVAIFVVGLFKKVVIADTCAIYADAGYEALRAGQALTPASAWLAVIAYSFQLYYDFSGYSDMAVGLARMFGVRFPANFYSPYKATGVIDFWRRWHITLSRFLRDYLYVPLGGNRRGPVRRYVNLAIVMVLGGLWHGANWTFAAWGAAHGALLALNHAWRQTPSSRSTFWSGGRGRAIAIFLTFFSVTMAWVLFRADSIGDAGRMYSILFGVGGDATPLWPSFRMLLKHHFLELKQVFNITAWFVPRELWTAEQLADFVSVARPAGLFLTAVAIGTFTLPNTYQLFARFDPVINFSPRELEHPYSLQRLDAKVALAASAAFAVCVLGLSHVSPFLYFQF
jgi:alginate O-acetyltransferase complex protein AlgI